MRKFLSLILILSVFLTLFCSCNESIKKENFSDKKIETESTFEYDEAIPETEETIPKNDFSVQPMLFECTGKNGEKMYLMGTIHISGDENDIIIDEIDDYLYDCDSLAVEFDIVAYEKNLSLQIQDLKMFVYTDASTIQDHMGDELYEKCKAFLEVAGVYNSLYDRYNIAMWSTLIEQTLYQNLGIEFDNGIDRMLIGEAYENDIQVLDIESAYIQYEISNSISDEYYLYSINDILDYSEDEVRSELDNLYNSYISGDINKFNAEINAENEDLSEDELKLYEEYEQKMIIDRNEYMCEKALDYLESGDTVFFAVGCGHLVGDSGLISLLEAQGYTVNQVIAE